MTTTQNYKFIPDLTSEIAEQLEDISADGHMKARGIHTDSSVKILLFPFSAGQVLGEHVTPHPAIMQVIKGSGEFTVGKEKKPVKEGSWIWMPGDVPHSVRANTEMVVLLQVFLDGATPV